MEEKINEFRTLVGGYYGVCSMDEYPLKEYILQDIRREIQSFIETNPLDGFDFSKEEEAVKEKVTERVKLQDALLVLNQINGPMDLVFRIKKRLKKK